MGPRGKSEVREAIIIKMPNSPKIHRTEQTNDRTPDRERRLGPRRSRWARLQRMFDALLYPAAWLALGFIMGFIVRGWVQW